jgi:antitoxin (DNA-binding transcriptional repressor) of toxin-antitoxin stability system
MVTVNIHEAKTLLSKLVDRAAKGEPFRWLTEVA